MKLLTIPGNYLTQVFIYSFPINLAVMQVKLCTGTSQCLTLPKLDEWY